MFDRKNHNMLALMLDPRFKNMCLVTMFLNHENAIVMVAEYDENLLLPLLTEVNRLLMLARIEEASNLTCKWILKVYFTLQQ